MMKFGTTIFLVLSLSALRVSGFVPLQSTNRPLFLKRTLPQTQLWPFNKGAVVEEEKVAVEVEEISNVTAIEVECVVPEELSETEKLMKQVKEAGIAGVISYALWELGFWTVSVPVCVFGYREVTGHWPDFSDPEDMQKLGAEAFAFVNFARFAVPLRIGLALSTTPWIQENIVDRFFKKDEENYCEPGEEPSNGSNEAL
mmetsp:Transcript_6220/g.9879  ORF Transcript_6220/g.9879 Transcript_6220/m.9879 type:complete len:200 (-) Transcript_6220:1316-1915(-)|eukprot:CAMPEP_0194216382 /NCGR_PEP_ID=MMETSP0156-20130528/18881_1 /TAXON_ID=33649 /ORGANISM="Thalassionema nitzschioides, Strain L26-B" /LENGTH=199 /DNA_ID=CAMNT_0038945141 /DNA_START=76 /DNA_END=675 /DNA_ORIENTATION=+